MREILNKYLQDEFQISKDKIVMITSFFKTLNLESGSLLLSEGQVANFIGFIVKGIIRTCEYSDTGNDITKFFFRENQFITNLDSYANAVPSKFYIKTLTCCTLLIIKKEDTLRFSEWPEIFNNLVQKTLVQKIKIQQALRNCNAKEKYQNFLHYNGDIVNRVPLQLVASYLGITPQSLSRIRKTL